MSTGAMNLVEMKNEIFAGYYWTQSNGEIPPNAMRGGIDKDGGRIFLGRAFHQGCFLPAKVIENQKKAFVTCDGKEIQMDEFQVLCKGDRKEFWWRVSSGGSVPPSAIEVGRTAKGEKLYFGRVFHDGALIPGKIQQGQDSLYIGYDGKELSFPTYEVLILED